MHRYFLVADADMPGPAHTVGHWHSADVGSHGDAGAGHHVVVLLDAHIVPPAAWVAFPRMTDAKTPIRHRLDHTKLADLGLTGGETTVEAADILGRLHPAFAL